MAFTKETNLESNQENNSICIRIMHLNINVSKEHILITLSLLEEIKLSHIHEVEELVLLM